VQPKKRPCTPKEDILPPQSGLPWRPSQIPRSAGDRKPCSNLLCLAVQLFVCQSRQQTGWNWGLRILPALFLLVVGEHRGKDSSECRNV